MTHPDQIIRERLDARQKDSAEPSDGRWELYREQKAEFEALEEVPSASHIVIDTGGNPGASLEEALRRIKRFPAEPLSP